PLNVPTAPVVTIVILKVPPQSRPSAMLDTGASPALIDQTLITTPTPARTIPLVDSGATQVMAAYVQSATTVPREAPSQHRVWPELIKMSRERASVKAAQQVLWAWPASNYTSTVCPKGYYCPANTTSASQYACSIGTFNPNLQMTDVAACVKCTPGSYCGSKGLAEPTGVLLPQLLLLHRETDGGHYCPMGSGAARATPVVPSAPKASTVRQRAWTLPRVTVLRATTVLRVSPPPPPLPIAVLWATSAREAWPTRLCAPMGSTRTCQSSQHVRAVLQDTTVTREDMAPSRTTPSTCVPRAATAQ
ncbi:hypothetical protein DPMN_185087, partial [Dreissena polymorpha]